jgi:uncharacterized protein (TIGR03435 family)
LLSSVAVGSSQEPVAPAKTFEVSSVRPCEPPDSNGLQLTNISPLGGNSFVAKNARMRLLLALAFGLDSYQLEVPREDKWIDDACFTVSAKAEGETLLTKEELQPRLQQLLVERFHLKFHRAEQAMKGYDLLVAAGGFKLKVNQDSPTPKMAYLMPGRMTAPSASLTTFASLLSAATHKPVEDQTGLGGAYTFDLSFSTPEDAESALPSLFTALQESYGLRLVPAQVRVKMLVVDSVEKAATDN